MKGEKLQNIYPLTPMQEGLLFQSRMEKETGEKDASGAYIEHCLITLNGQIEPEALEKCFQTIIQRHEIFRTVFHYRNVKKPVQLVLRERTFKLDIKELEDSILISESGPFDAVIFTDIEAKDLKTSKDTLFYDYIYKHISRQKKKGFDLSRDLLLQVTLFRLGKNERHKACLLIGYHHILMDGWSLSNLLAECFNIYRQILTTGQEDGSKSLYLGDPECTFGDYIKWRMKWNKNAGRQYWKKYLTGLEQETIIPHKKSGNGKPAEFKPKKKQIRLEESQTKTLERQAARYNVTVNTMMRVIWGTLLQRYNDNTDVVFGEVVSGRPPDLEGSESIIGLLINTIPSRINIPSDKTLTLRHLLQQQQQEAVRSMEFQYLSLAEIQNESRLKGKLINHVMAFENYPVEQQIKTNARSRGEQHSISVESVELIEYSHYDFSIQISPGQPYTITMAYNNNAFDTRHIESMARHFMVVLEQLMGNVEKPVGDIDILRSDEKHEILNRFNESSHTAPPDKTLHCLFEEQVLRTPDRIAASGNCLMEYGTESNASGRNSRCGNFTEASISYRQLNFKSNQLAWYLKAKGIRTGHIIALKIQRSLEMLIGIMGILKAGAAYLPIDPQYPGERVDYMINDSNARLTLTAAELTGEQWENRHTPGMLKENNNVTVTSQAYVIYTSGTTGKSKGVCTTHRNAVRVVKNPGYIELSETDRILQLSNFAFDGSIFDIFGSLLNGAVQVQITAGDTSDALRLGELIRKEHITVFFITTAYFNTLVDVDLGALRRVRKILFGGERISVPHARKALDALGPGRLLHMYGPTETTVFATASSIDEIPPDIETIPIGKPIANTRIYILDRLKRPVPVGISGEIYITGTGVAPGYINRPELTSEYFGTKHLNDELLYLDIDCYQKSLRIYRTGDRARWLPDGNIQYIGRIDQQVKIRGFRVEPGEIEHYLRRKDDVEKAVVLVRMRHDGDRYLCAYVVMRKPEIENRTHNDIVNDLKQYCSKRLPDYMHPSHVVVMDALPLNANGKVDLNALPEPRTPTTNQTVQPRDKIEKTLARIWTEQLCLKKDSIGIDDDYFQLGAHSLKATQLAAQIREELNIILPLARIFENPTIRKQAELIRTSLDYRSIDEKSEKNKQDNTVHQSVEIEAAELKEYYPLSPSQQRIYVIQRKSPQSIAYNMPEQVRLEGRVDRERLTLAFREVIRRHDSLRTSFLMVNDKPVQRVHDAVDFQIETVLTQISHGNSAQPKTYLSEFVRPFDLEKPLLMRAALIRETENNHILMVDFHHIISDGRTSAIVKHEFMKYYNSKNSQDMFPVPLQYKDYLRWLEKRSFQTHSNRYWQEKFQGGFQELQLPIDKRRPLQQDYRGAAVLDRIDRQQTSALKQFTHLQCVTLYQMQLTVLTVMLARITGQDDFVIGTYSEGRTQAKMKDIVGMFVNTLILRNRPEKEKTFSRYLEEVKTDTLAALENQDVPFELITQYPDRRRETVPEDNRLFDVVYGHQNQHRTQVSIPGLILTPLIQPIRQVKFDLHWVTEEKDGEIVIEARYRTALFHEETVRQFIKKYKRILASILENPDQFVSEIPLMTAHERKQMLAELNTPLEEENAWDLAGDEHSFQRQQINGLRRNSRRTAMEYRGRSITFEMLERKVIEIANRVQRIRMEKGTPVGILAGDRSLYIAAMMGIIQAGAAAVPMDPANPQHRLNKMIQSLDLRLLFIDKEFRDTVFKPDFRNNNPRLEIMELKSTDFENETPTSPDELTADKANLEVAYTPGDGIYIYFTSGTTGTPKAVRGNGKGLLHYIRWEIDIFGVTESHRISQFATTTDAFLKEVYVALLAGATLCIPDNLEEKLEPRKLNRWVEDNRVSHLHCVPHVFRILAAGAMNRQSYRNLRYVVISGETIFPSDLEPWFEKIGERVQLINLYGTTETTILNTIYKIKPDDVHRARIPIGKPIHGNRIIILDDNGNTSAPGTPGEICILTPYRTDGYIDEPELNREKFVPGPVIREIANKQELIFHPLMYRTGDQGRLRYDGYFELMGRIDRQVKIRGHRLEPGEIESMLANHPDVKEAAVIKKGKNNDNEYLIAYVVPKKRNDDSIDLEERLRNDLIAQLPHYMVPDHVIRLEKIPRKPSRKIDYHNLPDPKIDAVRETVQPVGELEKQLVEIWSEILRIENIGVTDNYFRWGGNSLNQVTLASKIQRRFNVDIPLKRLFQLDTIRKQAQYIAEAEREFQESITPTEKRDYYVQTSSQKRIYFMEQWGNVGTANHIVKNLEIEGTLDIRRLEHAFRQVIGQHEILRTSFHQINDQPVQRIHDNVEFEIDHRKEENERSPIELTKPPLLKVRLIPETLNRCRLQLNMHHIVSDGTSMEILAEQLYAAYSGQPPEQLEIQYKDYAQWQAAQLQRGKFKAQEEYWRTQFVDTRTIPRLNLPTDYPRPHQLDFKGERLTFGITENETQRLNNYALENSVTPYMLLLTAFAIQLFRYTQQQDIIVGTGTAGRRHPELQPLIGMFVNTQAIRIKPGSHKTIEQLLKEIKKTSLEALENQDIPFEEQVERLILERDPSRNPLFDVSLIMQNFRRRQHRQQASVSSTEEITIKPVETAAGNTRFDLTLYALEEPGGMKFHLEYRTALFKNDTIRRMRDHFLTILAQVVRQPQKTIGHLEVMTEEEKLLVRDRFNRTEKDIPMDKTAHRLFEEQVRRTPHRTAVVNFYGYHLTYRQLDRETYCLAQELLHRHNIHTGGPVGILLDRGVEAIIAILAILKAGAAYVPFDPKVPGERMKHMVKDAQIKIMLSQEKYRGIIEHLNLGETDILQSMYIDARRITDGKETDSLDEAKKPLPDDDSHSPAYVIYTSGTTGKPRGVVVEHGGLVNLCLYFSDTEGFAVKCSDRVLQFASLSFDASVFETFMALTTGAALYPLPEEIAANTGQLEAFLQKNAVTAVTLPPTVLAYFNPHKIKTLKTLITAGSEADAKHAETWRDHVETGYINAYGPTETTVCATLWRTQTGEIPPSVPIGHPIHNTRIYIVDRNLHLQPVGVAGELVISGHGLARGYMNKPELTAERFIEGHWLESSFEIGKKDDKRNIAYDRLYRTGDLAAWTADGNLRFHGRIDRQVKLRGYRIEPGEIEVTLRQYTGIADALVQLRIARSGEDLLAAYIESDSLVKDNTDDVQRIREYLSKRLPPYMVPTSIMIRERLPRTAAGKIDGKALMDTELVENENEKADEPQNERQKILAEIWKTVLNLKEIQLSVHHNFFQLGGHSIKATQLVSAIQEKMNVSMPMVEVFNRQTIFLQAQYLDDNAGEEVLPIEPVEQREYYPQTSAQQRFFMLHQLEGVGTGYNMTTLLEIEGEPEIQRMEWALNEVIKRNEVLRTSFHEVDGQLVQRVSEQIEIKIKEVTEKKNNDEIKQQITPFELSIPPLLRATLIHRDTKSDESFRQTNNKNFPKGYRGSRGSLPLAAGGEAGAAACCPPEAIQKRPEKMRRHVKLLFQMHHIISDGTTMMHLVREFTDAYAGRHEEERKRIQYKDFAQWQQRRIRDGGMEEHRRYWKRRLAGELPVLEMPLDSPRPSVQSFSGLQVESLMEEPRVGRINRYMQKTGTTLYMILQAALSILLSRYTGQEDIIIGTPIAGRDHADQLNLMGLFLETLPMRTRPVGTKTVADFMEEVKLETQEAYRHQEYPFREIQREVIGIRQDLSRNPMFDVMLLVQNFDVRELKMDDRMIWVLPMEGVSAKVDITLEIYEVGKGIEIRTIYSTALYRHETMERFTRRFITLLDNLAAENLEPGEPGITLNDLDIFEPGEKKRILEQYAAGPSRLETPRDVITRIAKQVERTPDAVAVDSQEQGAITYRQLDVGSGALAQRLKEEGIRHGDIVAILVAPSLEMVIGLIGILKAGGAYLPIAPDNPPERTRFILRDSRVKRLIVARNGKIDDEQDIINEKISETISETISQARNETDILNLENVNFKDNTEYTLPEQVIFSTAPAYVIYTSGTTGRPKGVIVEHGNLAHYVDAFLREIRLNVRDNVLQQASYTFDAYVEEQYPVLCTGATMSIPKYRMVRDIEELADYIQQEKITLVDASPLLLKQLNEIARDVPDNPLKSVRLFISGGDRLKPEYVANLILQATVYNTYGPTESTVCATYYRLNGTDTEIPIGTPITGCQVHILDNRGKPQPVGIPGELWVTGRGVARGYLNNPELTHERFVIQNMNLHSNRFYKTGDCAQWNENGSIRFLGRLDKQVKIRGYRIEVEEIETGLMTHPAVKAAVVRSRNHNSGENELIAYIVPVKPGTLNSTVLREHLSKTLPNYMIPSRFRELQEIPVTVNGKIDERTLHELLAKDGTDIGTAATYAPPTTPEERILIEIWQKHLAVRNIGVDTNYFDLGGQSITAMRIVSEVKEKMEVKIPLISFFKEGTIRGIANAINHLKTHQEKTPLYSDHSFAGVKLKKRKRITESL